MKTIFTLITIIMFLSCGGGGEGGGNPEPMQSPKAPPEVLAEHEILQETWEYHSPSENGYHEKLDFTWQGSCKAYAIRLLQLIRAFDFPYDRSKIAYCDTPDGRHAVLLACNDAGEWFLFEVDGDSGPLHWFPDYVWEDQWVADLVNAG